VLAFADETHDTYEGLLRADGDRIESETLAGRDADCDSDPRTPARPGLLAQRLDVAHRQTANEPADHQRLERTAIWLAAGAALALPGVARLGERDRCDQERDHGISPPPSS
jgi:hypothetical protein